MVTPLRPPPDAEDKLRDIRSVTDAALSHLSAGDLLAALLDLVTSPDTPGKSRSKMAIKWSPLPG